jgi:hypothetical protein
MWAAGSFAFAAWLKQRYPDFRNSLPRRNDRFWFARLDVIEASSGTSAYHKVAICFRTFSLHRHAS